MLIAVSPLMYAGLGCFFLWLCFGWSKEKALEWTPSFFLWLATVYAAGLSFSYLLVLLLPSLTQALVLSGLLALSGWVLLLSGRLPAKVSAPKPGAVAFFLLFLLIYAVKILAEPVRDWDARSIWFFQGKILYYGNGFSLDWGNPFYGFANLDYPKLFPALAAQSAGLSGYWNEYLPKAGILHLLVPLAAALAHLFSPSWSFLFYFLLAVLAPGSWMWNGYMDGYLALYSGLGLLFLWRWKEGRANELLTAGTFLLLLPSMKKEGALILVSGLIAWLALRWRDFPLHFPRRLPPRWPRILLFFILSLLPFLVWETKRLELGLDNQLMGNGPVWSDIWRRITRESAFLNITRAILFEGKLLRLLALVAIVGALGWWRKTRAPWEGKFVALFSAVFLLFIYWVLIASPMEQHRPASLRVNMDRVPLTILQAGFAFLFLYVRKILREEDSSG